MEASRVEIEMLLANATQGIETIYPPYLSDHRQVFDQILYHGVAGLLHEQKHATRTWPRPLLDKIREEALSRLMWELRHQIVLSDLLSELDRQGVESLLLKGSALAYDLYAEPHLRPRGDTDLLIGEASLPIVRQILSKLGFSVPGGDPIPPDLRTQEPWDLRPEQGGEHSIDLHWRALNALHLRNSLTFEQLAGGRKKLERLSPVAAAPDRIQLLLHSCLHRALHNCSPYFVGSNAHYGGNRLIWLTDIALLARSFTDQQWQRFAQIAEERGFAATCLDGLETAERWFGEFVPPDLRLHLAQSRTPQTRYFRARQLGRAVMDVSAIAGWRNKARYVWARFLPSAAFMRAKYPESDGRSITWLHGRRIKELLRPRPSSPGQ